MVRVLLVPSRNSLDVIVALIPRVSTRVVYPVYAQSAEYGAAHQWLFHIKTGRTNLINKILKIVYWTK